MITREQIDTKLIGITKSATVTNNSRTYTLGNHTIITYDKYMLLVTRFTVSEVVYSSLESFYAKEEDRIVRLRYTLRAIDGIMPYNSMVLCMDKEY